MRQGLLNAVSPEQSGLDRPIRDAGSLRPFLNGKRLSVVSEARSVPAIAVVHYAQYPAAIAWLIALIVVLTVDHVLWAWARPHVSHEVLKAGPSLADRNAATAIVLVIDSILCAAAVPQTLPNLILRNLVAEPVLWVAAFLDAAAGLDQFGSGNLKRLAAAGALAKPNDSVVTVNVTRGGNDEMTVDCLSGKVGAGFHAVHLTGSAA